MKMNHLLADDHSELDLLLGEVFTALDAGDIERVYQKLDLFWARMAMHIRAEHLHLFPAILGAIETHETAAENYSFPSFQAAQSAINELREDHDFFMRELSDAMKRMRGLLENRQTESEIAGQISSVRETVAAVSRRLEKHNEREESKIYEWADALLNSSECTALNERMRKEIGNLPPRFDRKNKA